MTQKKRLPRQNLKADMPEPNSDLMEFDLDETVIPVKVKDKEGKINEYILREASGDAACRWRNSIFQRTRLGPNGKPDRIEAMADTEPILVSLCLFDLETGQSVHVNTIRKWPNRVQKSLFKKIKEISDLDDDEEDKDESAKNGQGDITDGSSYNESSE